jgi:hypothetical protein
VTFSHEIGSQLDRVSPYQESILNLLLSLGLQPALEGVGAEQLLQGLLGLNLRLP